VPGWRPPALASAGCGGQAEVSDASFACPALQVDRWTAGRVPTYAYQFNDDHAPVNIARPGALPPLSTHGTELPYLFDQPNAAGWQRDQGAVVHAAAVASHERLRRRASLLILGRRMTP
jgi:carboxylesterase type B